MRNIAEAFESGPNVKWVCNVGPGGEPVRLVSAPGPGDDLVWFVPFMGPGVTAVNIVEGLVPRAVRAGHPSQSASVNQRIPLDSDMADLTDEDHEILGRIAALWRRVNETGGEDKGYLEAAADGALQHLDRPWPSPRWTEMCLMIAANSAVALWMTHRDAAAAYQRLQPAADKILSMRWLQGGPSGHFEGHEAQNVLDCLSQCEAVLTPRPGNSF